MTTHKRRALAWKSGYPEAIEPATFQSRFRLTATGIPYMVRAEGPCPRCKHPMTSTDTLFELEMFAGGEPDRELLKDLAAEAESRVNDGSLKPAREYQCRMFCNCGEDHPGRPLTARVGCGADFKLFVPGPVPS